MNPSTAFLSPLPREIKNFTEPSILKRLQKEKRGQGIGKHYKPFLTVRDVPSKGRVHRRPALTHNRVVHLLSDLELAAFLTLDWQKSVVDIREQYPLDPEKTIDIASRLGIKHPAYRGILQIMSTDLLIDFDCNGRRFTTAISIKYASDLENKRTIEKLELERRFWEGEGIDWYIFTEHEVRSLFVKKVRWLVPHMHSYDLNETTRMHVFESILRMLDATPDEKLPLVLRELDKKQGLEHGTNLKYFRHLASQNAFYWDMQDKLHTALKAKDVTASEFWLGEDGQYVHA
jgi:hypothetical protein